MPRKRGSSSNSQPTGFPNPTPEFCAASPFRKMPALVDGDYQLADSSAIIHYLEAKYPEPELIPADPRERGRTIWFDEFADTMLFACGAKMFFNRIVAPRFLGREAILRRPRRPSATSCRRCSIIWKAVIPDSGYLVGDRLTLADIAVAGPVRQLRRIAAWRSTEARYPQGHGLCRGRSCPAELRRLIEREAAFLAREPA